MKIAAADFASWFTITFRRPSHRPYPPLLLCCLLLILCGMAGRTARAAAPAPWPACGADTASQTLSFVHISDTHANYNLDPGGTSPMARLRGFVDEVRKENPYTLFTNAGDDYEKGSLAEQLSHGRTTRQVAQAMGYDVRTIGNHDLAWGLEELLAFSHDPTAAVLATNTALTEEIPAQKPGWVEYAELTVGCIKIGFFGLLSKPWNEHGEQYDGPYYKEHPELQADFDFVPLVQNIVARHRHDVDLLVLVSHLGIHDDIRVAEETEGLDFILGGHTHTIMSEPVQIKKTIILHTGSHAEYIGRLDIDYNLRDRVMTGHRLLMVDNVEGQVPANDGTNREIARILAPYQPAMHTSFARLKTRKSPDEMAHIAARATVETLGCTAAFIDVQTATKERLPGWLTPQDIFDTFQVEREPAGEQGFGSLYLLTTSGADLLHARAALPSFAYHGPETIEAGALYSIALPKAQALNQLRYFGREIGLDEPTPAGELWERVTAFGRFQNAANLALDEHDTGRSQNLIAALPKTGAAPTPFLGPIRKESIAAE